MNDHVHEAGAAGRQLPAGRGNGGVQAGTHSKAQAPWARGLRAEARLAFIGRGAKKQQLSLRHDSSICSNPRSASIPSARTNLGFPSYASPRFTTVL